MSEQTQGRCEVRMESGPCGQPATVRYPALGGGYMRLCLSHSAGHEAYSQRWNGIEWLPKAETPAPETETTAHHLDAIRGHLAMAEAAKDNATAQRYFLDVTYLVAENTRLRTALEDIASLRVDCEELMLTIGNDFYKGVIQGTLNAKLIAIAALATPEHQG